MKRITFKLPEFQEKGETIQNQIATRGGSYSALMTVIILAILVTVNVLVSILPTSVTRFDISAAKLYSITSNTKVVVNALQKDVTIYWIVQSGEEDSVIENLLGKYENLSEHIEVVKKNPDIYPTFTEQYTSETVENNSLIVESGDRSRYIGYDSIYISEENMYTYSYDNSFDGEGAITSAIDYVISEDLPQMYVLEGHGEEALGEMFSKQIEKDNIEMTSFSLLNQDQVPEEADCVMIYSPASDISTKEKAMLADYLETGGKLLVAAGPAEDGMLENLYSLLSDYGVESQDGVVVEGSEAHYAFQSPYVLLPEMQSSSITDPLMEENYYAIIPVAQGMTITGNGNGTVTELLSTSAEAFSKADGYYMETYEKEDGDTDGPFSLAVSVETSGGGQMIWFASSWFLDDMYNSYSSGANVELGMNAISSLIGEEEALSIRSKSLNYNYLTISESQASVVQIIMIGAVPLFCIGTGIVVVLRRRKLYGKN